MNKKLILVLILYLSLFWAIFLLLQNEKIYNNSLGLIADNWYRANDEIFLTKKPYEHLTNENYLHWDGSNFFMIRNNFYSNAKNGGEYYLAFFPLFPFIWKISCLPPIGILFLNYLFFSISIIIILKLFYEKKLILNQLFISLLFPGLVVFLIPYSEATFMLMVTIGVYGFIKNKYWLYFLGFFLAAMTRSSIIILLISFICAEFIFLFQHRSFKTMVKNVFFRVLPVLTGTFAVLLIQYIQGSGSFFKFFEAYKYWNRTFSIPHNLRDWSLESFGINIGVIFLLSIPLFFLIIRIFINQITKNNKILSINYQFAKDYLFILSALYIVGHTLFVLFYQGGSLNGLFRYTINTPFFYILLGTVYDKIKNVSKEIRQFVFWILFLTGLFILGLANYSTYWNFSDLGYFIICFAMFFWLFNEYENLKLYKIGLILLLFINIVWTTYLFNIYISNGWIFT
jgi:hypothetical protein